MGDEMTLGAKKILNVKADGVESDDLRVTMYSDWADDGSGLEVQLFQATGSMSFDDSIVLDEKQAREFAKHLADVLKDFDGGSQG